MILPRETDNQATNRIKDRMKWSHVWFGLVCVQANPIMKSSRVDITEIERAFKITKVNNRVSLVSREEHDRV